MVRLFMNQAERLLNTVIGPATYIMAVLIVVPTVLMTITLWRGRWEGKIWLFKNHSLIPRPLLKFSYLN